MAGYSQDGWWSGSDYERSQSKEASDTNKPSDLSRGLDQTSERAREPVERQSERAAEVFDTAKDRVVGGNTDAKPDVDEYIEHMKEQHEDWFEFS